MTRAGQASDASLLTQSLSLQRYNQEVSEKLVDGDTHSISLSERQVCNVTSKGQHRLGVSVATEVSPKPGPRDGQERKAACPHSPPRTLP